MAERGIMTLLELKICVDMLLKPWTNHGYAKQQEQIKSNVKRQVLNDLKEKYPDISGLFDTKDIEGLGYYSCYSDFILTYKGRSILGIGTHSSTIEKTRYRAEYDIDYSDRICEEYGVNDLSEIDHVLELDAIAISCLKYSTQSKMAAIELKIQEKERELEILRKHLDKMKGEIA